MKALYLTGFCSIISVSTLGCERCQLFLFRQFTDLLFGCLRLHVVSTCHSAYCFYVKNVDMTFAADRHDVKNMRSYVISSFWDCVSLHPTQIIATTLSNFCFSFFQFSCTYACRKEYTHICVFSMRDFPLLLGYKNRKRRLVNSLVFFKVCVEQNLVVSIIYCLNSDRILLRINCVTHPFLSKHVLSHLLLTMLLTIMSEVIVWFSVFF